MLAWTISKRRKESLGFLGDHVVKQHIDEGVPTKRCGFIGGKVPIREGTELFSANEDGSAGDKVGVVTSGTKGPSVNAAIGMAYVDVPFNKFRTNLVAKVRGKEHAV
jgi:aminomethyltransferase